MIIVLLYALTLALSAVAIFFTFFIFMKVAFWNTDASDTRYIVNVLTTDKLMVNCTILGSFMLSYIVFSIWFG